MTIVRKLVNIRGIDLTLEDNLGSQSLDWILEDIIRKDCYALDSLALKAGDVVVDIGAHVGTVSIYLAKKYPGIRIYAYEPDAVNYQFLLRNLEINSVAHVVDARECAVSGDGQRVQIHHNPANTGGSSMFAVRGAPRDAVFTVSSVTLDYLFAKHGIKQCGFLKLDCEGAEYQILMNSSVLPRVKAMGIEPHQFASRPEMDAKKLLAYCQMSNPSLRIIAAPMWHD